MRGRRGKKGKGYSLKCTGKNKDNLYVYIWQEYDKERTDNERRNNKNYSCVSGWRSLGNWNNPETWRKLVFHLSMKYELTESEIEEVKNEINQKYKGILKESI